MSNNPATKEPFILPFKDESGAWVDLEIGGAPVLIPIAVGSFQETHWLTADFYNPHRIILQLRLEFVGSDETRWGEIIFALYPQVRARLRIPASALGMNYWLLPREGALLKPMCGRDRIIPYDLSNIRFRLLAGPEGSVSFWQTPFAIVAQAPALLDRAESPHQYLLDALGQSATSVWPDKTLDESEMISRLQMEVQALEKSFPADWTRWGGSASVRFSATGFFRTHHDGNRWWIVDPDGGAFWSTGLCCVRPGVEAMVEGLEHLLAWQPDHSPKWKAARGYREHTINSLAANLIRAFGPEKWHEQWEKLAASFMHKRLFNTIGNWSDWSMGKKLGLPYTRPLKDISTLSVPTIFRDFPDVFHPEFPEACARWAEQLSDTSGDPAFLGYFLCNEPSWSIAKLTPAAGMLAHTETAYSRSAFAAWLKERHGDTALDAIWDMPGLDHVKLVQGAWNALPTNEVFERDAQAFSGIMAAKLFDQLSEACKKVAPHHLNLGARFAATPPDWLLDSLQSFDVFSFNSYSKKPRPDGARLSEKLQKPVLIGEWHFGAADTGMPAAGLESVATQQDRSLAYRRYVETHAAEPWCVGVHWFTLYDQSAIGRYDGEPYNCGFIDVCHREQSVIAEAAQATHQLLYSIVSQQIPPTYLPLPNYTRRLSL